jgi:hypothetical protein
MKSETVLDGMVVPKRRVIPKRAKIIIPNEENLEPEEVERLKHNERIRRSTARSKGQEVLEVVPKHTLRKIDTAEMVEMAKDTRNKAVQILDMKLTDLFNDPEQLQKTNLATLATVFGILFDKAQLAAGLSTQNIAISAKIDVNMSSDKALDELNKMREKFNEQSA